MTYDNTKTILDYINFKNKVIEDDNYKHLLKPKEEAEIIALYFLESNNYPIKLDVIKSLLHLQRKDIIKYMFKNMTKEQFVENIKVYNKSENRIGFKNDAKKLIEDLLA